MIKLRVIHWIIFCIFSGVFLTSCENNPNTIITPANPAIATELATNTVTLTPFAASLPLPSRTPSLSIESSSPTITLTSASTVRTDRTPTVKNPATATLAPLSVKVYESAVTFKAYPFEQALRPRLDPNNHFTFNALDQKAYETALGTQPPTIKSVRSIILENEYIQLTFLPELGGRLFQIVYKPTGQNLFYNNRVLKPTSWGPANQGGWLAVGGMEWALPVNEHGYEWGTPWQTSISQDVSGATLTLVDSLANDRVRAKIQVTLPAHAAYIIVHPRIENPTATSTKIQFWINSQMTLGASKNVSPNTEFVLPANSVWVHSTGDQFIPARQIPPVDAQAAAEPMSWPLVANRDMSRYSSWDDYLGVFATNPSAAFVGAYNHDTDLGLARVFPQQQVPGVKLFAFGPQFCCRDQFSDDGSDYFELWGGLPRTFFAQDAVTLAPGEVREWNEYWLPFARTGGLSYASRDAVLFVKNESGNIRVGAFSPVPFNGTLVLFLDGKEINRWVVTLTPNAPFTTTIASNSGSVKLQLLNSSGGIVATTDSSTK